MPNQRLRLKTSGTAMKDHFQLEAGNKILKKPLRVYAPFVVPSSYSLTHLHTELVIVGVLDKSLIAAKYLTFCI
ncbi:hypothetical protein [Nostoc sp.]|uniref:hypothetical protein n=1 Tax=Nostoc sp. TaxID=1180 RepID=UPI002FF9CCD5